MGYSGKTKYETIREVAMQIYHIDTMHPRVSGDSYVNNWADVTCVECLKHRPVMHWWMPPHTLGLDDIATKDKSLVTCAKCLEFKHRDQYIRATLPDDIDGGGE